MRARLVAVGMAAAAIGGAAVALQAADGVVIVERSTRNGGAQETNRVEITASRMRAESTSAAGEKQAIVFDGAKQTLYIVNLDKKTYNEMTKADVDRMAGQVSDAMAQMRQQMANLPPEQRARIEAMMKGRGSMMGAAAAKPEYKKVGTDTVGKWTCTKYEGYENGKKTSEVCTVAPGALGLTAADFQVTRQLADFFGKLAPQRAAQVFSIGSAQEQGFSGVPVRRSYGLMGQQFTNELVDVSHGSIPDSTFEVPAGFTKQPFPGMGGRGR